MQILMKFNILIEFSVNFNENLINVEFSGNVNEIVMRF